MSNFDGEDDGTDTELAPRFKLAHNGYLGRGIGHGRGTLHN